MLIASLPLLICLLGLVIWFVASAPLKPWAEMGKIVFAVGLLATVCHSAAIVKLF